MIKIRVGFGFDVHQLAENESFIIGGVSIPYNKGTVAHSDGDVLIHAICDALLGAANMRDIGYHFPDSSADFKNIDSSILLEKVMQIIDKQGYNFGNLDATICLQKPKLKDFIPQMQQKLSEIMKVEANCISIKATTTEKLGFVGREEGIAAYATVLIEQQEQF